MFSVRRLSRPSRHQLSEASSVQRTCLNSLNIQFANSTWADVVRLSLLQDEDGVDVWGLD